VTQIDSLPPIADNDHWLGWEPSTRQRHPWRIVVVVLLFVVAVAVYWTYSYNPLAQSWQQDKGEFGSYVGTVSGVEAHFTTDSAQISPLSPMATTVWNEPPGKFVVQFETEINNTGSHAVHVVSVGEPSFDYHVSNYRVSFFRSKAFPQENGATFHSFTLAGHSERIVTVSYSQFCTTKALVSVNGRALPSGPAALPVTFSVLGFTHTDEVLVAPFTFVAPAHC
jgi:hypothetical protein